MTLNLTFMTTASNCRNQIRNRVTSRSAKVKREFRLYSHFATITNRGQNKKILFNRYHTRIHSGQVFISMFDFLLQNFTVICEGEKGWVQCKQYELIKVTKAFWGRDDHVTCPKIPAGLTSDRLCETTAENTLKKVNGQCKNEQACEVVASNIFFDDDTCGNIYKYLKIWYECIPDEANAVDVLKDGGKRRRRRKKKRSTKEKRSSKE